MIGPVPPELLMPPPAWAGEAWPPTVERARAALESRRRSDTGGEGSVAHYPSDYLALGCAHAAAAAGDEDLLFAYGRFAAVSNLDSASKRERYGTLRAIAAIDSAPTLAMLGHRGALLLALKELEEAEPWATLDDGVLLALRQSAGWVAGQLAELQAPATLVVRGPAAEPESHLGRLRLARMPSHRIDGCWRGLRVLLENWGLRVVGAAWADDARLSVRATPDGLLWSPWEADAELLALAGQRSA